MKHTNEIEEIKKEIEEAEIRLAKQAIILGLIEEFDDVETKSGASQVSAKSVILNFVKKHNLFK